MNFLQTIQTSAEIIYKQVPGGKKPQYEHYLDTIEDRVAYLGKTIEKEMFDKQI